MRWTEWDEHMNRTHEHMNTWTEQDEQNKMNTWTEHFGSAIIFEFCKNTVCTF